ncbi:DNA phosphorothioation system protein DndB [Malaciobacter marinus]|uniref:DNA phosphorothioation system protein DndB n=1 Tax=Malaciobacter marinus TaxID=505249 RepID=A0A347TH46_9BACT|nr:DNA sulfur modification protein DndB [Malaciobacter marinus]AXX85924.1 DNA phosphorothioation system protein DndB [Malaciobacter marinus]PHO14956.1 hypothetical protein CPH92_08860 [Malaciobacter marinus]
MSLFCAKEKEWDINKKGHSGVFKTKNDISIEYIQTTFNTKELDLIKPLRSIFNPDDIEDFDLLLQRDLDETRIKRELIPYLKRDDKLSFFPSLLVVVLNIENNGSGAMIKQQYPPLDEQIIDNPEDNSGNSKVNSKKYGDLFSVEILVDENEKKQRWFSIFNFNRNTQLLAIDGQHRLVALQAITGKLTTERDKEKFLAYSDEKELFNDLEIPVTILYVPDMHQGTDDNNEPLTSIFRQVFVDVNKNAITVSKMRNILLDENDFNSIFTRMICSEILKNTNLNISINEIEWNKEQKVDQLTEELSITSIVFIKNFLDNWLGDIKTLEDDCLIKDNLQLSKIKIDLEDETLPYDEMTNKKFTYNQKNKILEYFSDNYLNGLIILICSLPLFNKRHAHIKAIKNELTNQIENHENIDASNAYKYLFGGNENNILLTKELNAYIKNTIMKDLIQFEDENHYELVKTQMFQVMYFKIVIDIYADQEDMDFNIFLTEYNKIINDIDFINAWKDIFVNKYTILKTGIGNFGKNKQNLIYDYLQLFMNKHKDILNNGKIKFEEYDVNIKSIYTKFEANKIRELEKLDLDEELYEKQLENYKNQLKEIYIEENVE